MDKLWAPWRNKYISSLKKKRGCIFCRAVKTPKQKLVVFKTRHSICMLNIFPYNNGHLMVCPLKHTAELSALNEREILDLFHALLKAQGLLQAVLKPQGYNIGMNLKRTSGAGITGHLHVHIVPRWNGDTNFMPVLGQTKVISESLRHLHKRLKDAYAKAN
ncbi:MAG: HIT domain-containing protein [Candidatus Omnitrophica bacterium]|nr:HIT domain-containing protein [Candidatus Omnitrophota bacterium]